MTRNELLAAFSEAFGDSEGARVFFAPGRVNLIGEHTDYNGGHVFPCALTIGTYGVIRKRTDRTLKFYSLNFKEVGIKEVALDNLEPNPEDEWTNYPKGVIWAYGKKENMIVDCGLDIMYFGTIPNGSGLSSSASIEVLTAIMLRELFGFDITNQNIALLCQYSENKFNKVKCGIMDQFAIAMGKEGNAIFLDTATLEYEYAPVDLPDAKIVIINTNKKRGLNDSKYNERRRECEIALAELQQVIDVKSLGDVWEKSLKKYGSIIGSETRKKRARHAVTENQRTIRAVDALRGNDIAFFGQLMNESHDSLRDDYEVTGIELDTAVEEARKVPGCIGARMTGAGFGGCAVSIVKNDAVDNFIKSVGDAYKEKIGYAADFYVVEIGGGPREITE